MTSWALILAIVAFAGVILVIGILYLFFDLYKKEIIRLDQKINYLPKDIARRIINDQDFQLVLDRAVRERTKELIVDSTGKIVNFILARTVSLVKEHLNAFNDAKLMKEVNQEVKRILDSDQSSQKEPNP